MKATQPIGWIAFLKFSVKLSPIKVSPVVTVLYKELLVKALSGEAEAPDPVPGQTANIVDFSSAKKDLTAVPNCPLKNFLTHKKIRNPHKY